MGSTAVTFNYTQPPNPKSKAIESATSNIICEILIDSVVNDDNPFCTTGGQCM